MRQEQAQEQVASVVVGSELSLDDILATLRADERAISAALRNEAQVISPEAALLSAISRDADLKSRMALAPKIFANGCVARLAGADGEVDIVAGFAADNARALARFAARHSRLFTVQVVGASNGQTRNDGVKLGAYRVKVMNLGSVVKFVSKQ